MPGSKEILLVAVKAQFVKQIALPVVKKGSILGAMHSPPSLRVISSFLLVLATQATLLAGLGSKAAEYLGGTIAAIPEQTEATTSTANEKEFTFTYKGGALRIPYDQVNVLEYGQKAGRRIGVAIMVNPFALLSKKRRHFLTINYLDANDKQQAAVFELGKDVIRVTLAALEARTGKKIEYQDEEARKAGRGN